jgi:serine/threonine protein kinase
MEDLTGKQIGPYQIVAPLGEGGMAAVFRAYQPGMERYVALKILPRALADDPAFSARFQREARILAQLQHPHILPVFDYGQAEGYSYIVMPYVLSGTLTDAMQGEPLPLPRIRQVISQVGDALSYARGRGLVHRDVKPSNVLVDESGNCLLTDFGVARMVESSVNLTATGAVVGTPAYMSPEQGVGREIDARSDIYSLGIILYEMATGRVPYKAETPIAVVFMHVSAPLPLPRSLNPALPEAVERVILKALAKNPDERYQTAEDMVEALKRAIPEVTTVKGKAEPRLAPKPKQGRRAPSPTLVALPDGQVIAPPAPKKRVPGWVWVLIVAGVALAGLFAAGGIVLASRMKGSLPSMSGLIPFHPTASPPPSTSSPVLGRPASASSPTPRPTSAPTPTPPPTPLPGSLVIPITSMSSTIPWLPIDTSARPSVYYLGFTVGNPPLDNVLVRQALASSVDRTAIVGLVAHYLPELGAIPATSFTPPQTLGLDLTGQVGLSFDPARAQQLLKQAGYSDPSSMRPLTIFVRTVGEYPGLPLKMAEAVAGMWREHLGIEVVVEGTAVTLADRFGLNPPDVFRLGWAADINDPDNFLYEIFRTGSQYNYGGWQNPSFLDLVSRAHAASDPKLRQQLYVEAERILCETDAAVIPLFHTR